jgi:hypothetical protein
MCAAAMLIMDGWMDGWIYSAPEDTPHRAHNAESRYIVFSDFWPWRPLILTKPFPLRLFPVSFALATGVFEGQIL